LKWIAADSFPKPACARSKALCNKAIAPLNSTRKSASKLVLIRSEHLNRVTRRLVQSGDSGGAARSPRHGNQVAAGGCLPIQGISPAAKVRACWTAIRPFKLRKRSPPAVEIRLIKAGGARALMGNAFNTPLCGGGQVRAGGESR